MNPGTDVRYVCRRDVLVTNVFWSRRAATENSRCSSVTRFVSASVRRLQVVNLCFRGPSVLRSSDAGRHASLDAFGSNRPLFHRLAFFRLLLLLLLWPAPARLSPSVSHLQPSLNYRQRHTCRAAEDAIRRHAPTFYTASRCARRGRGNRPVGAPLGRGAGCSSVRRVRRRGAPMMRKMMPIARRSGLWASLAPVAARQAALALGRMNRTHIAC